MFKIRILSREDFENAINILNKDSRSNGKYYQEGQDKILVESFDQIDLLRECGVSLKETKSATSTSNLDTS